MKPSTKIFAAFAGIAFVALGILCICNPGATILTLAVWLGIITLCSGISTLVMYFRTRRYLPSGNMLLSAIFQIILGCIFLSHNLFVAGTLPIIFAFWILIEGIILAVRSFDFKAIHFSYWWLFLILGILAALVGLYSIREPFTTGAFALSYLVGSALIFIGVVYIMTVCGISSLEKKVLPED